MGAVYTRRGTRFLWMKWTDARGVERRESAGTADPVLARKLLAEVERQELQRLSVQTEELTVQLHEDAASARTSRPDVPRIEFRPLSPGETILAYASACPGAWVVPLSCDAFVALICIWTILAASDVRRRTRQQRVLAKRVFLDGNAPARLIPRHQMQPE